MIRTTLTASIAAIIVIATMASCNNRTNKDFNQKSEELGISEMVSEALNQLPDEEQKEALKFLYAYMSLGDIADYDPSLYVDGVKYAYLAKQEMPWGATIPKDVFRHFVLPLRVNNENLDSARTVFYKELKDRVSGLSMYDAVLEVNHWCHEKVIYTPSDARTSSPLASIRTAYGRCGEESTFTVSALRAVGIPARQVYTPRWAHTDDNHAWVEAWVDGTWYYLGACEPEAKLNVAWFSSTALRSLLMHNRVFGYYIGSEDVIQMNDCITEINVTSNYAPVDRLVVKVKDSEGNPVKDAKVEFKIYNYAEFYSAITTKPDSKGRASAVLGNGDVLVWASKGDKFGFVKAKSSELNVEVVLDHTLGEAFAQELDIVPPAEGKAVVELTQEETDANSVRLHYEDSVRNAYTATFIKPAIGSEQEKALVAARGNWREIRKYINNISESAAKSDIQSLARYGNGMKLLKMISEKDLRDTPAEVLFDHLDNYKGVEMNSAPDQIDLYQWYVLNPRIGNELLTPWRGVFQANEEIAALSGSPEKIIDFVKKIKIFDNYNPQNIPITPLGVLKLKAADSYSRNAFFVAVCRSLNIPARIEELSGKVQYHNSSEWIDVNFAANANSTTTAPKGYLKLTYEPNSYLDDPKFDSHFTVAKIENGSLNTLNFRDKEGYEGTMSYNTTFGKGAVELDCGYYMVTSGTRMASGKVLSRVAFFTIEEGETTEVELIVREDKKDLQVIGTTNADPLLPLTGRGMFVLGFVKNNHEPSNHIIRDIYGAEWNYPVVLMFTDAAQSSKFKEATLPPKPEKVIVTTDDNNLLKQICNDLKIEELEMPLVLLMDSFGRIFYTSQGYTIGITEQICR